MLYCFVSLFIGHNWISVSFQIVIFFVLLLLRVHYNNKTARQNNIITVYTEHQKFIFCFILLPDCVFPKWRTQTNYMCMAHFSKKNNAQQIISIIIFYLKYNCAIKAKSKPQRLVESVCVFLNCIFCTLYKDLHNIVFAFYITVFLLFLKTFSQYFT